MVLEKNTIIVKKIQYWRNLPMIQEKKIDVATKARYGQNNAMILEKNTIIVKKIQYWKNLPMIGKKNLPMIGKNALSIQSQVV